MQILGAEQIKQRLEGLAEWEVSGDKITRIYQFPSFQEARAQDFGYLAHRKAPLI